MLSAGKTSIPRAVTGVMFCGSICVLRFSLLTRASEIFAETSSRFHETYCLRRAYVAIFRRHSHLPDTPWPIADRVVVRFRRPTGDQWRKGAAVTRVRVGPPRRVGAGRGAVDLRMELLSCSLFLAPSAPLSAFGIGHGRWSMWTQQQATEALRSVVALAGGREEDYALHSLRLWGAIHLSASDATPEVLQRKDRWAFDAYKAYVRTGGKDAGWLAGLMAREGIGNRR